MPRVMWANLTPDERRAHCEKTNAAKLKRRAAVRPTRYGTSDKELAKWARNKDLAFRLMRAAGAKCPVQSTIHDVLAWVSYTSVNQRDLDADWEPKRPCQPTSTEAGSAEKIAVLRNRVDNGEELFHAEDPYCDKPLSDAEDWGAVFRLLGHYSPRPIRGRDARKLSPH